MSEVQILDDDLEEGEIADDTVPEPCSYFKPKNRKLPRRYTLNDHKNTVSKHKKNCKHASHHHRKKTKVSPILRKKHHKSCPHHSSDRHKIKTGQFTPTKGDYFLESSLRDKSSNLMSSVTLKSAFRNFSSPPRTVTKVFKHNNIQSIKKDNSFSTKCEEKLEDNVENVSSTNTLNELFSPKFENESFNDEKLISSSAKQSDKSVVKETKSEVNGNCSEDEDEEELRRIALSTCLKRPSAEEDHNKEESYLVPSDLKEVINISNNTTVNGIFSSFNSMDNYEVVDMDVDDNETPNEEAPDEELFVIDTTPVVSSESLNPPSDDFVCNSSSNLPNVSSNSEIDHSLEEKQYFSFNEDFEEELLRAEIIASMNSFHQKQQTLPKAVNLQKNSQSKLQSPLTKKQPFKKVIKKSLPLYSKRSLTNFTSLSRKRGLNKTKLNYTKLANHKKVIISPQRKVNTGQERIVITLNNDSSTEESDQEQNGIKDIPENVAVASIEALISDARQKSDTHTKAVDSNNLNTVSCLSKAQQEEYNSLKKILAEKQILSVPPLTTKVAKVSVSPDFSILAKKISVAKENLEKEIKLRVEAEKELAIKKQIYMTSKLKVQHLKEQLHAAELNRATNLELWKKSAAKLDILKKSVLKREALVNLLEERLNSKSMSPEKKIILSPVSRSNTLVN